MLRPLACCCLLLTACSSGSSYEDDSADQGAIVAHAPSVDAPKIVSGPPVSAVSSNLELEVHALVNAHRTRQGLPALVFDDRIGDLCRDHSRDMSRSATLSHDRVEDREARIAAFLPYTMVAENVGMNQSPVSRTAREVVEQWLASAPHRRNIEGPFDATGIGHARAADGSHYYTQMFARSSR